MTKLVETSLFHFNSFLCHVSHGRALSACLGSLFNGQYIGIKGFSA